MAQADSAHTTKPPARPRSPRVVLTQQRRERLEAALHDIVELLDLLDGDPDIEPSTSVLSLGYGPSGCLDECEDGADAEPSLGSTEIGVSWALTYHGAQAYERVGEDQRSWTLGCSDSDMEGDWCEHEANGDDEPGDNGIADDGGADEVMGEAIVHRAFAEDRAARGLSPFLCRGFWTVSMP